MKTHATADTAKKRTCTVFAACVLLFSLVLSAAFSSCAVPSRRRESTIFDTFDTVVTYTDFSAPDEEEFRRRSSTVFDTVRHLHRLFDIYHTYDGLTNLASVNLAAGGEPVAVSDELFDFLAFALDLSSGTGGKTDITLGAVTRLWHDARAAADAGEAPALPGAGAIADALTHTGRDLVELDPARKTVRITDPLCSLDVGAVAKGYAVEFAAKLLEDEGISGVLINGGGNVRTVGTKPGGTPFTVALRDPAGEGYLSEYVSLSGGAVAQSGGYERYLTVGDVRYSHIIDPATGYPPARFAAVSVVYADAGIADALSTALICLPEEEGRALLASYPGAYAVWVLPDGSVRR